MTRRLVTTRRHVALDRSDEYLDAWAAVRSAVEAAGGHAWIFRGAAHEDQFIEFIEWSSDNTLHESDPVARARALLDTYAVPGATEEWEAAG